MFYSKALFAQTYLKQRSCVFFNQRFFPFVCVVQTRSEDCHQTEFCLRWIQGGHQENLELGGGQTWSGVQIFGWKRDNFLCAKFRTDPFFFRGGGRWEVPESLSLGLPEFNLKLRTHVSSPCAIVLLHIYMGRSYNRFVRVESKCGVVFYWTLTHKEEHTHTEYTPITHTHTHTHTHKPKHRSPERIHAHTHSHTHTHTHTQTKTQIT